MAAASITASATVWLCHHDTHRPSLYQLRTSTMLCLVSPSRHTCAWLLLSFNKDSSFINLMLQLIKWGQLRG